MTLETWLIYLAAGRLITWMLQINGLLKPVWNWKPLLQELSKCDLCLGFWIYLGLAIPLPVALSVFPRPLSIFILACLTSLIAHLLRIGWTTKFGIVVIE